MSRHPSLFTLCRKSLTGAVVLAMVTSANTWAAEGDFDPSFGTGGKIITPNTETLGGFTQQADGKTVVSTIASTYIHLNRFNIDGSNDYSFGTKGSVTLAATSRISKPLIQLASGKLLLAHSPTTAMGPSHLQRYNIDGTPDNSFGVNGKATIAEGSIVHSVLEQADGKLVVVGQYTAGILTVKSMVERFNTDGTLDTSFGGGTGKVLGTFLLSSVKTEGFFKTLQQPDGKLLIAGMHGSHAILMRLNTNGSLDTSFGGGTGKVEAAVTPNGYFYDMALQADSKFVIAGKNATSANYDLELVRFNSNGSLDTTFGAAGIVTYDSGSTTDAASKIYATPNGKLLVVGTASNGTNNDACIYRFNSDGSFDNSFSGDGKTLLDNGGTDSGESMVLQPDNKAVIAGKADGKLFLARIAVETTTTPASDSDGDGVIDAYDQLPANNTEWLDNDMDGIGNQADPDDDNDGLPDTAEAIASSDPFDPDSDNDGIMDGSDPYPTVPAGLDTSFNSPQGYVQTAVGSNDSANAILQQKDNKIVLAGSIDNSTDFALVRYKHNGDIDPSFGGTGKVITDMGAASGEKAMAVIQQTDGKLVAVGLSNNKGAVARYNPDGSLDTTFGGGTGKRLLAVSILGTRANAVVQEADGRLLVASRVAGLSSYYPTLVRLNNDGTTSTALQPTSPANGEFYTLALQKDGKIVAAGKVGNDTYIARYNTDLTLDNSFGTGGSTTLSIGNGADVANSVAIQADGKVITAGYVTTGSGNNDIALARLTSNGALDGSFGSGGMVITAISTGNDQASAIAYQHDGKLVVAGTMYNGTDTDAVALRYNSNGALDTSLRGDGSIQVDLGATENISAMSLEKSGKILLAGSSSNQFLTIRLAIDRDDDRDSIFNNMDLFTLDATEWSDNDGDGIGDNADPDDDNDGIPDTADPYPLDASPVFPLDGHFNGSSIHEATEVK